MASFGNKKAKVKDATLFCEGCKSEQENLRKTEIFSRRVLEETGHTILEVDFSSRKTRYQCGNCNVIVHTFVQNFDEHSTQCCSKCQNDKHKISYPELKEKVESHGFTLLTSNNEYQNNKQKLRVLCVCGSDYQAVLSDLVRDKNCMTCKTRKFEATCIDRYGVRNVSQDPTIFERIVKHSYAGKDFYFPGGKKVHIQGYEGLAISTLLEEKLAEDDVCVGKEVPTFSYVGQDGTPRVYHPDLYVKSLKLIVEVKSDYTYLRELDRNTRKFRSVIESGFPLRLMIYNGSQQSIKDILIRHQDELSDNFLKNDKRSS